MGCVQKKEDVVIELDKPVLFSANRKNQSRYNVMLSDENSDIIDHLVNLGWENSRSGVINRLFDIKREELTNSQS